MAVSKGDNARIQTISAHLMMVMRKLPGCRECGLPEGHGCARMAVT